MQYVNESFFLISEYNWKTVAVKQAIIAIVFI
jgi:hypothetical protein